MRGQPAGRGANRLILRGYGPLAGLLVVLLLVTVLVPSKPRTNDPGANDSSAQVADSAAVGTAALGSPIPGSAVPGSAVPGSAVPGSAPARNAPAPGATRATAGGSPGKVSGADRGDPARADAGSHPTATQPNPARPAPTGAGALPAGVQYAANCSGGAKQDGNSGYSPPCLSFTGNNGGATSRGVTKDTITVTFRDIGTALSKNSELSKTAEKKGIVSDPAAEQRTRDVLLQYFNNHFQLYGRQVKLLTYQGRGDALKELSGTGQEAANADALKVGQEIKAFADLSAISQPYLDALVRQKVVAFGGLHLPASYYRARAPYAWGELIDCTTLLSSAFDLLSKRMPATANAVRAGSAKLRTQPRKYALVVPDDAVYAQCLNEARPKLKAAGIDLVKEIHYSLDFSTMQQEAPNIAAQLKNAGTTTVILVTDPVLPFFLSGSATQQDFWPEWFVTGTVFTDADPIGQLYDQDQWQFAYGQSFLGDVKQGTASESYRAYRTIRSDQPTATRDLQYYSLLMLFIGLQMAGPDLTPQTFERGMFAYPGGTGPLGHWSWAPDHFTPIVDAREIYWDRKALSPFDNQPGRYVAPDGDRRYRGVWPVKSPSAPVPPPAEP